MSDSIGGVCTTEIKYPFSGYFATSYSFIKKIGHFGILIHFLAVNQLTDLACATHLLYSCKFHHEKFFFSNFLCQ